MPGRLLWIIVILFLLPSISSWAQDYQCLDSRGNLFYSSRPCPSGMEQAPGRPVSPPPSPLFDQPPARPGPDAWIQAEGRGPWQIKGETQAGLLKVKALVNGTLPVDFLVDSGASLVLISSEVASDLGIRLDPEYSPALTLSVIGGKETVYLASLKSIVLGPVVVKNVLVSVFPRKEISLLGQTFLTQFRWAIEHQTQSLLLDHVDSPLAERFAGLGPNWWRNQFGLLNALVALGKKEFDQAYGHPDARQAELGKRRALNLLRFAEDQLSQLTNFADENNVPRDWRR